MMMMIIMMTIMVKIVMMIPFLRGEIVISI